MSRFWHNRWFKIGAIIAIVGWSPLLCVILLSAIGLWPDPRPNPIGLGLLFFVSFWPAVILMLVGSFQVWFGHRADDA